MIEEDKATILIVDDSYTNRFILENILVEYRVLSAENGSKMWLVLKNELPDLILLDIMMPGEDGFQIARKLADNPDYSGIPIIFVSAKDTGKDVAEGFELGAVDYIKKPYDDEEIKVRIKRAIDSRKTERELRHQAIRDPLTELFNRRYILEKLRQTISYTSRNGTVYSIAMLDLDHFKVVNDTFGHQAGDQVLRIFGSIIKNEIRDYDTAGRFGGEEFMILFEDCDRVKACEILDRIRDSVKAVTIHSGEQPIRFTFSAGVVESTEVTAKTDTAESLISMADFRLYLAKDTGRDRIVSANSSKKGS